MKKISLFLMPLVAMSFLASCGGGQASKLNAKSFNASKNITNDDEVIWENDGSHGDVGWSANTYVFYGEGHETGSELAVIPTAYWKRMKSEKFYLGFSTDGSFDIQITTVWMSTTYSGGDILPGNPLVEYLGGGNYVLTLDFANDPIGNLIDEQGLLLYGGTYTPQKLYFKGSEPPGPTPTTEIIWENGDPEWYGPVSWNGKYRFGLDGHDASSECIKTFPQEIWDKIKTGTFYLDVEKSDGANIRVTTGWWSIDWPSKEHNNAEELIPNGDGTYKLEINFEGHEILDLLDEQHLLFTGDAYTPLKLYFDATPPEPDPQDTVWENDGSHGEVSWGNGYLFAGPSFEEEGAYYSPVAKFKNDTWNRLKTETFYVDFITSSVSEFYIEIFDGVLHSPWPYSSGAPIKEHDKLITDNQDGTYTLTINFHQAESTSILDTIDERGVVFFGQFYTPQRIYFINHEPPKPENNSSPFNIPLLAGGIGGGVGLALLLGAIFILIRHKIVKVDNIVYAKKASGNPNFDEYVVSFDYKKRKANYFIFTDKKARVTLKDVKKEFSKDQRNGKLRKYIKKLFR